MKSIQLHDSIEGLSQKIVSITLHYITFLMPGSDDIVFFFENTYAFWIRACAFVEILNTYHISAHVHVGIC